MATTLRTIKREGIVEELKIEKGVPITNIYRSKLATILEEMEIGDSIEYGSENFQQILSQIRGLHKTEKRFITRRANAENTRRRIWRTA